MINDWRKRLDSWINQLTHWQLIGLAFLVSLFSQHWDRLGGNHFGKIKVKAKDWRANHCNKASA